MNASITAAARAAYEADAWWGRAAYDDDGEGVYRDGDGFVGRIKYRRIEWMELPEDERAVYIHRIRAAFAAIRVPSDVMLDAATTSQERRALFALQWTYAIDALLSEAE